MIILKPQHKLLLVLIIILLINISIEYSKYQELIDDEVYETKVKVLNIYPKKDYNILRLSASNFDFFTNIDKSESVEKLDILNILILSKNISFLDYLKGFYAKSIIFKKIEKQSGFKDEIIKKIDSNHEDNITKELFQALFLAIPISKELRDICTNYGISHLIALSGFHLGVLSFVIYWIFYFPYTYLHKKYFLYRNKKYDLLLVSISFLFFYLILTNVVPSLLRAFVMFVFAIFLLRYNIKLFSYTTLFIVFLIVISLFPKYFFSLGFWFSIIAVFYIFLFLQYFSKLNKYLQIVLFNLWMFLIFNPIVHFYFPQTSYEQFLSPLITILFTFFYPFEIFAHIFDFAIYFDGFIKKFLYWDMYVYNVETPFYFFIVYLMFSLASIFYKKAFWVLNILMIIFNLYLYNPYLV
ncbi:MAG: ComEC/Rec2 family competence protein [Aliarcobacter sp.]|nr:ComEC/Rec2 family competence protein [Aliarcobacter sp.]